MDNQNNRRTEIDNEGNHGEATEKPSRICDQDSISANVKCEEDTSSRSSSQDSQSKPTLGNSSQTVDLVEISSDDELQIVEVTMTESVKKAAPGDGTDRDQNPSSSTTTSGRTSPKDITCSVCLSEYENKAFVDKCFHAFCYFCILQWSEIVQTCPLCKSSFTSIIHSVKSMDNYQQHYLSKPEVNSTAIHHQSQGDGRRFRYRTTLADGSQHQQQTHRRQQGVNDAWAQREQRRQAHLSLQRNRGVIARERRRTIYSGNLWVQGVTQTGRPRQRDICKHFVNCNFYVVFFPRVELTSEDFCNQLRPFLFDKTEHFIHEFISFARSPFDITAYDERAQYSWPNESRDQVRDTPTVFNSSSAGWQTPAPGPSGVSLFDLSETDWNRDSPVLRIDVTNWSPDSSPGQAGNFEASTMGTVTISSSNSSQTVSVENLESDERSNGSPCFNVERKRRISVTETTSNGENRGKSRKKHSKHRHKHRHKHKRRHERNDSLEYNKSRRSDSPERHPSMPGPSNRISDDSSITEIPVDVIILSDGTASPDVFDSNSKSRSIDFSNCRGRRKRKPSSSRSPPKISAGKGERSLGRSNRHRSRSRSESREKRKTSPRGERSLSRYSEAHSRRENSCSRKTGKAYRRSRSREGASPSREQSKERFKRRKKSRSRSRSRQSHSRSSSRSQSRSKGKTALVSRGAKSRTWRKSDRDPHLRSISPLPVRHESSSFSRDSRSRSPKRDSRSRSRHRSSLSSSRNLTDTSRDSRSPSHKAIESKANSASESNESTDQSNEDIRKEIEDLELRINADKKRLLKLLIKQERTKGDGITAISEETESAPREEDHL
ncbi:unnamed protein product [Porites evermanni]|uniref:RING-type E3 ubiquitin transferase n=1 Tax=Porites evermanni TaxID=104178 RepID=A0ABN8SFQ4_9CNID|nr:unnamed protein product [Porites evermanni]